MYIYDGDEEKRGAASQRVVENTEANKLGLLVADDIDDDWEGTSAQGDGSNGWYLGVGCESSSPSEEGDVERGKVPDIGSGYSDDDGGKGGRRDEYSRSRDSGLDLTAISDDERLCDRGRGVRSSTSGEPMFSLDRRVKFSPSITQRALHSASFSRRSSLSSSSVSARFIRSMATILFACKRCER